MRFKHKWAYITVRLCVSVCAGALWIVDAFTAHQKAQSPTLILCLHNGFSFEKIVKGILHVIARLVCLQQFNWAFYAPKDAEREEKKNIFDSEKKINSSWAQHTVTVAATKKHFNSKNASERERGRKL